MADCALPLSGDHAWPCVAHLTLCKKSQKLQEQASALWSVVLNLVSWCLVLLRGGGMVCNLSCPIMNGRGLDVGEALFRN